MDYSYIRAWGQMLGSFRYFIDGEVEKARASNAPATAIYRKQDGSWAVFEDIQNDETRALVQRQVDRLAHREKEDQ